MILFPAIDVLNGRAVRLLRGKKENVTDYGLPLDRAKEWIDCGAKVLHVVDLSGAFEGESRINSLLERICSLGVPVQSGGGLRSREDVKDRLNAGASRVIIGTLCYENPELFSSLVEEFGEKIVAGMDAKGGFLAGKGWTEVSPISAIDFGKKAKQMGVTTCVFTDISKDGSLTGVSLTETEKLQRESGLNVIASGGISSMADLIALRESKIYGAILGKSIYSGAIDLKKAIEEFS